MNILIIRFSSLGDLVTLEPTFRAIKYFYKNDNITLLTSNVGKSLYLDTNYFDEYIIHKKTLETIKHMAGKNYDLIINLQCNKPSHYISMFINKKTVVNKSYNLFQKIFNIKVHVKSREEILLNSGIEKEKIENFIKIDDGLIKLPVDDNKFLNLETSKKIIAISTGTSARWESKKWFLSRYIELIKRLIINNYEVILIGTSLEVEDSLKIKEKIPDIKSYVDKTNLTELKKLLSEVDLFIGNDSGPAHIAAAVGTDTITIFGSTDVKHGVKFTPYHGNHEYLKASETIICSPCYKSKCPTKMECMDSITVEHVLEKINLLFKKEEQK